MHETTKENLKNAFAGESQAHMKYLAFAAQADKEGKPNVARMFRAISYAEQVHAVGHLKVLDGVKTTAENLKTAFEGETFEINEMYPDYHEDAKSKGDKAAERATHYALEAEKIHAAMYEKAQQVVAGGADITLKEVYICPVCGYTHEGEPDDACPVCGVKKEKFVKF